MRKICFAVLLVPALAWAQPKTASDWYKEGENQYNLGNFDKAVEAFKQAFTAEPNESKKAVYLFNVAQSYRQANDCKNAYFFYKRFLSLKEADTVKPLDEKTRKQVEDRISELEACAQQATAISKKPPQNNLPPDGNDGDKGQPTDTHKEPRKDVATTQSPPGDDGDSDTSAGAVTATAAQPHVISARVLGGVTKVNAGDRAVPIQATFALVAGYPIPVAPKLTVEAGAAFTFTPVPFDTTAHGTETGQMWGLVANAAATYEAIPKLGLRADLGLGALFFANISESPFTGGAMTSGALSMFHLRGAVSGEYAFTPNVVLTVTPVAFTYSPPKGGLAPDIKSITSIDFAMVGIGYRK
jgi:tetratricopeptide (TPR) repeat protein